MEIEKKEPENQTARSLCPECESDARDDFILIHSGINVNRQGFVHLAHGAHMRLQFTPDECRAHALSLLEVAEAAEDDGAVAAMLTEEIHADLNTAVTFVSRLRKYRTKQKRGDLPVIPRAAPKSPV